MPQHCPLAFVIGAFDLTLALGKGSDPVEHAAQALGASAALPTSPHGLPVSVGDLLIREQGPQAPGGQGLALGYSSALPGSLLEG